MKWCMDLVGTRKNGRMRQSIWTARARAEPAKWQQSIAEVSYAEQG
jgi:hypothetical protein